MSNPCNTAMTITALLITLVGPNSRAAVNWYWNFDQTLYTVAPSDVIVVTATLYNDLSSDGNLIFGSGVGASFTGDMQFWYDFRFGRPGENFGEEFLDLNAAPGESFHFTWGSLTPRDGFVPLGTYGPNPAALGINGSGRVPDNSFQVIVVPEPCPPAIAGLAVVAWLGTRLVKRASRR